MKEEEIRPNELFNTLLNLIVEDVDTYFSDAKYTNTNCPACNCQGSFVFSKNKFDFDECTYCKTFYVNPRPDKKSLNKYYTESKSTRFWATTFYKATEKNRREKIWKPKAKLIYDKIMQYGKETKNIVDIGGGYGIFIEEFNKISSLTHLIIEPSHDLAQICRSKNLFIVEKFLEDLEITDLNEGSKTFVSFELFEHLLSPKLFLETLYKVMDSNDLFIFTTLNGMGVDIQSLWNDSKAISPPMHLNFFNPKSVSKLLGAIGFEMLEASTPGKLDINIMENNIDKIKDRFWKNFIDYSSAEEKDEMQKNISDNLLSSHMMIVCKKV